MTETKQANPVRMIAVADDEAEVRLDRWFKRRFPWLTHGRLEKLLRTGQIRVEGKRADAATRVFPGQMVRVPPLGAAEERPAPPQVSDDDVEMIRACVLKVEADLIVLNKPAGLAVQGGTGSLRHVDGMLDALRYDAPERPKLVHRLDRDTSGLLVLARSAAAAAALTAAFRRKEAEKIYWAVTVGCPSPHEGKIDFPLAKSGPSGRERVATNPKEGQPALTYYQVLDTMVKKAALVELRPVTGRTHQLRVHCAAIGKPILGDGKYGGGAAFLEGVDLPRQVHLHARKLSLPRPGGGRLVVEAPLPPHMVKTFSILGLSPQ